MQQKVFYPRYTTRGSADVLSITLFVTIALTISFLKLGATLFNMVGVLVLVYFIGWFSRVYIRRILFESSYFVVEKYIGPPRKIPYTDVTDMGLMTLKTRKGEINLAAMSNVAQLHSLFFELMEEHRVDVDQSENQALVRDLVLLQSFWPTVAISAVLVIIVLIYVFFIARHFNIFVLALVLFLIVSGVSFAVDWFYKRRMNDQ